MTFLANIASILFLLHTFNITEFECRSHKYQAKQQYGTINQTLEQASQMMTEYPLGISDVFDDASSVFGTVLGNLISKKKFLGLESFYLR